MCLEFACKVQLRARCTRALGCVVLSRASNEVSREFFTGFLDFLSRYSHVLSEKRQRVQVGRWRSHKILRLRQVLHANDGMTDKAVQYVLLTTNRIGLFR